MSSIIDWKSGLAPPPPIISLRSLDLSSDLMRSSPSWTCRSQPSHCYAHLRNVCLPISKLFFRISEHSSSTSHAWIMQQTTFSHFLCIHMIACLDRVCFRFPPSLTSRDLVRSSYPCCRHLVATLLADLLRKTALHVEFINQPNNSPKKCFWFGYWNEMNWCFWLDLHRLEPNKTCYNNTGRQTSNCCVIPSRQLASACRWLQICCHTWRLDND